MTESEYFPTSRGQITARKYECQFCDFQGDAATIAVHRRATANQVYHQPTSTPGAVRIVGWS